MLNRIVTLYLDFAELQALEEHPMTVKDWAEQLDYFLKMSRKDILQGKGSVSHEQALLKVREEYKARMIAETSYVELQYFEIKKELKKIEKKE